MISGKLTAPRSGAGTMQAGTGTPSSEGGGQVELRIELMQWRIMINDQLNYNQSLLLSWIESIQWWIMMLYWVSITIHCCTKSIHPWLHNIYLHDFESNVAMQKLTPGLGWAGGSYNTSVHSKGRAGVELIEYLLCMIYIFVCRFMM